jgi:uncharacterized protein (DUF3820 family)
MTKTLDALLPELRRPFTPAAIKFKPQATSGEGDEMKGLVSYFVDSRLVVERLNAVVGPVGWTDAYKLLCEGALAPGVGIPVECALTVLGYTKTDVGQIAPGAPDDKAWKSAYSDAFKRAAVKFSVGAYLYGGAGVWAPVKVGRNGKAQGFTPEGARQARQAYTAWIASGPIKEVYGEPLDHGDVLVENPVAEPKAVEKKPPLAAPVSQAEHDEPASATGNNYPPPPEVQQALNARANSSVPAPEGYDGSPESMVVMIGTKHKGKRLDAVPRSYLEWLASESFTPQTKDTRLLKNCAVAILNDVPVPAGGVDADPDIPFMWTWA